MTLLQMIDACREHPVAVGLAIILGGLFAVKKVELPVWGWLAAWWARRLDRLGQWLNASLTAQVAEMNDQIVALRGDLDSHIQEADCREASRIRERILIFSAQLGRGWRHTEEMYVDILSDIDWYEDFCGNHPEYHNSRAVSAIRHVQEDYAKRLLTHDFA